MVGKYHAVSVTFDQMLTAQGFGTYFGYLGGSNDYYKEVSGSCDLTPFVDLWDSDKPAWDINGTGQDQYEEDLFAERVLQIVHNHHETTPLFPYDPPHIVHTPVQVPEHYVDKFSF